MTGKNLTRQLWVLRQLIHEHGPDTRIADIDEAELRRLYDLYEQEIAEIWFQNKLADERAGIIKVKPRMAYKLLGTSRTLDPNFVYDATTADSLPDYKPGDLWVDGFLLAAGEYTLDCEK